MCGIAFCLSLRSQHSGSVNLPEEWEGLVAANAARGEFGFRQSSQVSSFPPPSLSPSLSNPSSPCLTGLNSHLTHMHSIPSTSSPRTLTFFSSVLHLRGPSAVVQPVVDEESGDVFCWNGQVFEGLDNLEEGGSDTLAMWRKLRLTGGREEEVRKVFGSVEGP